MFWKKKSNLIIKCPVCEWLPDGGKHWNCDCGNIWNTFDTKALCRNCGFQWQDTQCPGCGKRTPHSDWYKTKAEWAAIENSRDPALVAKKKSLEAKLISYGITNHRVSYLPYLSLNLQNEKFQSPYDAGCRMLILRALAIAAHDLTERPNIIEWLTEERIWHKVSPNEQAFLSDPYPDEQLRITLSWRAEAALTLGWCLNKVEALPPLDEENTFDAMDEFQRNIPDIGDSTMIFLTRLEYRDMNEIDEENLLNELVTSYYRDLTFSGKRDPSKINATMSFERHTVLNWLRTSYMDDDQETTGELWDEVDTST